MCPECLQQLRNSPHDGVPVCQYTLGVLEVRLVRRDVVNRRRPQLVAVDQGCALIEPDLPSGLERATRPQAAAAGTHPTGRRTCAYRTFA